MKALRQLQENFLAAIVNDEDVTVLDLIQDSASLPAKKRLAIYRDSIRESLLVTLQETYPVCRKLVGDKFFRAMAKIYITQTPSYSPDLGNYGDSFANFIANFPHTKNLPYLPDVARLEWAWSSVHHGFAEISFDFSALEKLTEAQQGKIVFRLLTNSVLLASAYPVHRIWEVNQDNFVGEEQIDCDAGEYNLFIWREHLQTKISLLSAAEYALLIAIKNESTVESLNEELLNLLPEIFTRGWISGFKIT